MLPPFPSFLPGLAPAALRRTMPTRSEVNVRKIPVVTCASGQVRHIPFHTRSCRRCSVARSKVVRLRSGSRHYQVREGVYDIARGLRRMTRVCSCAGIIPAKRREERVRRSTKEPPAYQSESSSTICADFPIDHPRYHISLTVGRTRIRSVVI